MTSQEDIELSDGGVIESPEDNGDIRRRDVHGNMMEVRSIGDEGWDERAALFDYVEASGCGDVACAQCGPDRDDDNDDNDDND